ncbi:MAG TPA: PAS domain S-box protein [Methylomirabilota bacterium]|jgi:PAS domain S-box-containing protein
MPDGHLGDLQALLTEMRLAVVAVDRDGRVVFWSPAAEQLFGWRRDEIIGHPLPTVPDELREQAAILRRTVLAGSALTRLLTRRRRRDGTVLDVELSLAPLRDAAGAPVGALGLLADVTDRGEESERRRGDELAAARLAAIVDSSDDAIVSKTLDGVVTSWNAGAERIFGWTAAEAVGRHITFIIPKERHAEENDVLARIMRGEVLDHFETVRVAKDGRLLNISLTVSPVRDSAGRIVGASKIARDVTERMRGDMVRGRLAAIVDSAEDVIVGKTLEGVITSWNAAAERTFGWTAGEAEGRHITLIVPEDRRAEEEDVLARIRRGERVEHFETVRVTKDGRLLDMSLTVSPIIDSRGRIIGVSKIARDVTERRRFEKEREQLLAREQEARAEAEALNRTKDEFLAMVSHELRTPLNSIFGWARMLQSTAMDAATQARAVDAIVRGASAQARLVDDLLDLSRIVTGRMRLDLQRIHPIDVIEAALDAVRPAAAAKDIEIVTALDGTVGTIVGAPDRLQQVVWNLVMNAVKFTPTGGRVTVSLRRAGPDVEIVVADTGEGISADLLPHVFERFRQEDSSSVRAHGGLGLGLALVRHLVELHGGQVHAASPGKGRGATFTVKLPRARTTATPDTAPMVEAALDVDRRALHGVRVLVVDDDPSALEVCAVMLRSEGAEVRAATSAFGAYEIVTTWRPHVLVSDIAMPGADGYMLLRALRTALGDKGGKLPAIAVTAFGTAETPMRVFEAGFDLYLTKPVDPLNLSAAVTDLARRPT